MRSSITSEGSVASSASSASRPSAAISVSEPSCERVQAMASATEGSSSTIRMRSGMGHHVPLRASAARPRRRQSPVTSM